MKAEYIDHMGSDLTVVNAARVSFDKESEWEYEIDGTFTSVEITQSLSERDDRLVHYLASHGHWTPFSHPQVTLRETVPIFVARQRFKHVVGFSYNEVSRRYVDTPPEFYIPDKWRPAPTNKKQGSADGSVDIYNVRGFPPTLDDPYRRFLQIAEDLYKDLIGKGVCPEQARMVLPQSMYTSYYVTGSLAAWARAYTLRSQPDAQQEIQALAAQWNSIIEPLFPVSWKALTKNNA